jgi:hypothetical protein
MQLFFIHRLRSPSFLPPIGPLLPQDSRVLQWNRNAVAVRYHPRRIICRRAGRRHCRAVNVAAWHAGQRTNALHLLLPHGSAAHHVGGVKRLTPFTAPLPRIARYAMLKPSEFKASPILTRPVLEPVHRYTTRRFSPP